MQYGELYHRNFYKEVQDKNRVYYEDYHPDGTEKIPADYKEMSFVCLRPDGMSGTAKHTQHCLPVSCKKAGRFCKFPFPPVATYLHKQPSLKQSCSKRYAVTVRTL